MRADAACALGDRVRAREIDKLARDVVEKLAVQLYDKETMVRFEAAVALAEVHDKRATPLLLGAMQTRAVRLDAIRALGTLGNQEAIAPLQAFMKRWLLPWADRLQAAAALCALGDKVGADYLVEVLGSRRRAERAAAIHFLGESHHPQGLGLLESILMDVDDPMRDVAARALGHLGDAAACPKLEAALNGADAELRADIENTLRQLTPSSSAR